MGRWGSRNSDYAGARDMIPTKESAKNRELDRIGRKLQQLRLLSPAGYPWAAAEIKKLEQYVKKINNED